MKRSDYEAIVAQILEKEGETIRNDANAINDEETDGNLKMGKLLGYAISNVPESVARITTGILEKTGLLRFED